MRYECPACSRTFDNPGFCPYDGKPLFAAEHPTLPSGAVEAQTAAGDEPPRVRVRALSATDGGDEAKAALREQRGEYDRLVGETLDGRYTVQRKLGEGGMGVVFAAKHAIIERPLAIKVLKREATRDGSTVRRFVQEAKAASRIGHPNIVDVTDFGTTPDGLTYSVMELVDGPTLKKVIRDAAPLQPARAVRIAAQLARALAAAHDKGIIHRDLKPENVFLIDRDGRTDFVKIVDFGIAKVQPVDGANAAAPKLTRQGAVVGTPEYMAPEQASGRGETDHRVDIYALGTMLYEMLVARVPHKDKSVVRTIAMQLLDPVTPPSQVRPDLGLSPQLEAIVMKTLAKNRDERYPSMAQFYAALESLLPQLEGAASATTLVETSPRRARPPTKPLHEPEFVAGPLTLPAAVEDDAPPSRHRPSRVPWILAALALLSVGAAVALIIAKRAGAPSEPPVAGGSLAVTPRDAAAPVVAVAPADASSAVVADVPVAVDAGTRATSTRTNTSTTTSASTSTSTSTSTGTSKSSTPIVPHPDSVTVEILTRPAEANVFVGATFLGPSGTHHREPWGTRLTIECRAPHFKGTKQVVFDGSVSSVLCTATRLPFCVPGLHNPIDDCEPTAGSDGSSGGPVVAPGP